MAARHAVVIGVDRTGGLPLLQGAAADSERVAAWLDSEGFAVELLSDTQDGHRGAGEVTSGQVLESVAAIVAQGTCVQLVVYFAGHGLNNFGTEIWLLSRAPQAAHEAINLEACVDLARDCGIQSVCFISDACRSNPPAGPMRRVTGIAIFPNTPPPPGARAKVDRLLPTIPNAAANEVDETIDDVMRRGGIFTTELLRAHGVPTGDMPPALDAERELVGLIRRDGQEERVVDLSRLAAWLEERVPLAAADRGIAWPQQPECIVETPPRNKFLGRARFPAESTEVATGPLVTLFAATGVDPPWLIEALRVSRRSIESRNAIPLRLNENLRQAKAEIIAADQTAFHGASIHVTGERVVWASGIGIAVEPPLSPHLVRVRSPAASGSVAVQFSNGIGTVVAALRGYTASILVCNGGVANVSYVAGSDTSGELRAEVAARMRYGAFQLRDDDCGGLAERIQNMRGFDPTVALYAAYAWRDADRLDEVRAIMDRMRVEFAGTPFLDLAMLAARGEPGTADGPGATDWHGETVPFCPLLMRGWSFLRASRIPILPEVRRAADHLVPALWTTFEPEGINILRDAIETGRPR